MIIFGEKPYRELRCNKCRDLICYEYIFAGRIHYPCPRCGYMNVFTFSHLKTKHNKNVIKNEFTSIVENAQEGR